MRQVLKALTVGLLGSVLLLSGLTVPVAAATADRAPASVAAASTAASAPASAPVSAVSSGALRNEVPALRRGRVCRASWLALYGCVMAAKDGIGWVAKYWGRSRKCVKRRYVVNVNPSSGQPTSRGYKCVKFKTT